MDTTRRARASRAAEPTFMRPRALHRHLRAALGRCGIEPLTWYQASRHTYASQWVMANGSMEKLAAVLGHSSAEITRRYTHLRADLFAA